ncbi:MAG: ABC transporter substrate-binding protein [Bryobacterales bacterium]|jgi:ABC-type uncharacterized transport system substrate-binding protein|nr:ABC transporter substrate-binding protein [Bryobacterales bacterium]
MKVSRWQSRNIGWRRRDWLGAAALGAGTVGMGACALPPAALLYVSSYHQGYGTSDAIEAGIRETLADRPVTLETVYLDGKRQPDALPHAATRALERIRELKPRVILVSDDDAMIHLVVPHLRQGPTPVLFCGVNWTASPYEVPTQHVSGMIEVLPVEDTIRTVLGARPDCKELFILSEDSSSERKSRTFLDPIYWRNGLSTTYGLVPDFDHWKKAFRWANMHADLIFFITNGAIRDWNHEEALAHFRQYARVPVFTCDEHMMKYAMVGRVKVAREQGEWVARQALRVLEGVVPGEIPLARNQQSRLLTNPELAALIQFPLPSPDAA